MKLKEPTKKHRPEPDKKNSSRKISTLQSPQVRANISFILQHLNSPINIFDHHQKKFIYVNDKFTRLIGINAEECYAQELKDFGSWIHPGDLTILQNQIGKRLHEVYLEYIHDHSEQLNYMVNFRLKEKDKNGMQVSVLAQCAVIEWDKNHLPASTLNMLSDITNYKNNQKMVLTVNLFDEKNNQWKTILREEFLLTPDMLSVREKEIVTHIIKDKSATKISQELNIPFYTVRSHWRNILQKTRCKTQKELKHMALAEGWG